MSAIFSESPAPGDVLRRAQSGDHDAFASLVVEHQGMVFSIAYHFFSDRDRAEEIAQDVFLTLYRNLGSLDSLNHVRFWLRQVTSRRCIDEMRRGEPKRVSLEDVPEMAARAHSDDVFATRRLRKMVATLPHLQRLVVTLRFQEDLGPSDISRVIGIPVNTIKSHLHRALTSLRKQFGDQP